jgi:hypothetical protein
VSKFTGRRKSTNIIDARTPLGKAKKEVQYQNRTAHNLFDSIEKAMTQNKNDAEANNVQVQFRGADAGQKYQAEQQLRNKPRTRVMDKVNVRRELQRTYDMRDSVIATDQLRQKTYKEHLNTIDLEMQRYDEQVNDYKMAQVRNSIRGR